MKDDKDLIDVALSKILDDMDDMEGKGAMEHSLEECENPMECNQHGTDAEDGLNPGDSEHKPVLEVTIEKHGSPTMTGSGESGAEESLSPDEKEMLKKMLGVK